MHNDIHGCLYAGYYANYAKQNLSFWNQTQGDLKVVASRIYGVARFILQALVVGLWTKLPKAFRLALVS